MRQPALVVLDLVLEDGSGLALLDRVRASDGLSSRIDPELRVILLSGRAGDADRVREIAPFVEEHGRGCRLDLPGAGTGPADQP